MAEVGVLNLTIESNAGNAARGLGNLEKKLRSVGDAAANFDLSNVTTHISNIVSTAKGSEKAVASLGTLFNAISNFAKIKTPKIDVSPIEDLKKAFGSGINTGNVGSQLNQLRTALEGEWNTDNAGKAASALSTIASGANELKGSGISTVAKNVSAVAKALDEYAQAAEKVITAVGGGTKNVVSSETLGQDFSSGMAQGIKSGESTVESAASEMTKGAIESVQTTQQSHSPSVVMIMQGENFGAGYAEGIRNSLSSVIKEVTDFTQAAISAASGGAGKVSDLVASTIRSSIATALENTDMTGAQKNIMQQAADAAAGFAKTYTETSQKDISEIAADVSGFTKGVLGSAMENAFPDADSLSNFAKGLTEIASSIESGAKSYATLGRLATSMEKVKSASVGFKFPDFSRLESLARALQENFNAENGLKRIAEGMEAIKAASEGFTMPNLKGIEKVAAAMNLSATQQAQGNQPLDATPVVAKVESLNEELTSTKAELDTVNEALSGTSDPISETANLLVSANNSLQEAHSEVDGINNSFDTLANTQDEAAQQVRMTTEELQEQLRVRKEILDAENQARLEKNYGLYRELFLSKEDNWENQVPEMYGLTPESIEANETYADALKQTLEEVNAYVDEYIEKMDTPAGTLLRDTIDQAMQAQLSMKKASESASVLRNAPEIRIETETDNVSDGMDRVRSETQMMNDSLGQAKTSTHVLTESMKDLDKELKQKKADAAGAASGFLGLKETFNDLKKAFSTTVFGKLAKQFANIAKRMAIRAVIRQVTSAFKEGTENVYRYSQAIGGSFASDMDSAATSLLQLKNSIGAAIAPAIQAVIPYLNQLVNVLIEGINYVNQFFALLNGQSTWTKALPYATKAFDDQKKSAKGAHQAMKDLLADWDELNIIQSENSGGGGGSSGKKVEDYASMFTEVNQFDSKVVEIANYVKDLIGFVGDHLTEILGVVTAIKWGARLAKFSGAFTGAIGNLLGLASAGFIIKLTIDAVSTLDNKFLETGNAGYLVGDMLTTLVGGFFAKKVLTKVLGGSLAKIAIPLTFAVSAAASIKALVDDSDVSAISEKGILMSLNAALKGGGAVGTALYSLAGWTPGMSLAGGAAGALFTFGLSTGIKAIAETVEMGEITQDVIKEDLLAAATIGAGLGVGAAILGGTIGTIVAAATGGAAFAFVLLIGIEALVAKDAPKKVMYGDVELTNEEVQKFVENKMFSINVNATIDNIDATVANKEHLRKQVGDALTTANIDWNLIKLGVASAEDYDQLKKDIVGEDGNGGLVGAVQGYIDEAKNAGKLTLTLIPKLVGEGQQDASEWFTSYTTGWDEVNKFVQKKGEEIGQLLTTEEGKKIVESTPEVLAALMEQVNTVTSAITGAQISSEAFANLNVEIGDLDKTSLDKVITAYTNYVEQLEAKERELAIQQYTSQGELVAGLIAMGADPEKDPLKSALEKYEYMGKHINDAIADGVDKAARPGKEMIKEHFSKLFEVDLPDIKTNNPIVVQMLGALGIALREGTTSDGLGYDLNRLLEGILETTFEESDFKFIKKAVELGAMNYIDFFDDDTLDYILSQFNDEEYKKIIKDAWDKMIQESLGEETTVELPDVKTDIPETISELASDPEIQKAEETVDKVKEVGEEAKEAKENILTLDNVSFDTKGVENSSDTAATAIEDMARRIRDAFASLDGLSYEMDISGQRFSGAMSVLVPEIKQKASGGFVKSGDLVLADENGKFEMMGRMGNQPVVANNQQIVSGISQGVSQANTDVVSELRAMANLMQKMLQKEFVARAVPSSAWGNHNAQSNAAYEKVTG